MTTSSRVGTPRLPPPPPPVRREPTPAQRQTQPRVDTSRQGSAEKPQHNLLSAESSYQAGGSRVEVSGKGPGGIDTSAYAQGPSLKADAKVDGKIGLSGIDVKLNVDIDATAVEAGAEAKKHVDFEIAGEKYSVDLDLQALGKVGADGHINLDLHVGTDGNLSINASANGFAGAQASLTGGITLSHEGDTLASGSITASASAGVSGDAHANVGLHGGKLEFDVGVEATAGLGLGVDVNGSVNPGNVLKAVGETAAHAGGEVLKSVADGAINAGGAVAHAAGDAFNGAVSGLGNVVHGVGDAVGKVGHIFGL